MRKIILQIHFNEIACPMKLDKNGDLMGFTFDIINGASTHIHNSGYWSNRTSLSVTPPEITATISDYQYHIKPKLADIIWPGESETMARDWPCGKELAIGLPRKTGY